MAVDEILPGLCGERYEEIKADVASMFERARVCSLPVNAFETASRLGFHVIPYNAYFEKASVVRAIQKDGFSAMKNGEVFIFCDDAKNYARQNWTVMHEIAHILLGHKFNSVVAEREADFFAKYAMIPPPLVNALKISTAEEIQKYFIASREAAEYGINYYQKWLRRHCNGFTRTEKRILRLFAVA